MDMPCGPLPKFKENAETFVAFLRNNVILMSWGVVYDIWHQTPLLKYDGIGFAPIETREAVVRLQHVLC